MRPQPGRRSFVAWWDSAKLGDWILAFAGMTEVRGSVAACKRALQQQADGVFEDALDFHEELGGLGAVGDAVIGG